MDVRNGIPVRNCVAVQSTVVTTRSPVTRCFLGDHVEWRGPGTGRGTDDSQLQHVLEFPLGGHATVRSYSSGSSRYWWASGLDVVCYIVKDRCVWGWNMRQCREVSQQCEERV